MQQTPLTPNLKETPNTHRQNESTQTNNEPEKSTIKKEKKNIQSYTSYPNISMAAIILIVALVGLSQQQL